MISGVGCLTVRLASEEIDKLYMANFYFSSNKAFNIIFSYYQSNTGLFHKDKKNTITKNVTSKHAYFH